MPTEAMLDSDKSKNFTFIDLKKSNPKETEAKINRSNIIPINIKPKSRNETEEDEAYEFGYPIKQKKLSPTATYQKKQYKKEVDGIVLEVENISVNCEIYLESGNVEINLPIALFPEKVHYGMPISLSLDECSGIRCPVIKVRHPSKMALNEGKEKMDALIAEL